MSFGRHLFRNDLDRGSGTDREHLDILLLSLGTHLHRLSLHCLHSEERWIKKKKEKGQPWKPANS